MFWFCSCLLHVMEHVIPLVIWSSFNLLVPISSSNESDRLALLTFKNLISEDPLGALNSWNNSLHFCQWNGVQCSRSHRDRVTVLDLESQKLKGTISPHIGNLSFLKTIRLTMNNFHGPIPQEIGRLFRLEVLWLNNNSFNGEIPTNLSQCSNIRLINLIDNKLSGRIPREFTALSKLTHLGLGKNELGGSIPSWLGNLSSLATLSLQQSNLLGSIPDELCCIQSLEFFTVNTNNLTGMVPSCLHNLSHLRIFDLTQNYFEGNLPKDMGRTLPNLRELYLGLNMFSGSIPLSLPNASKLERIEFGENEFTGQVPRDLGRLQGLSLLSLIANQLGSTPRDDLDFITSLTNCSNLEALHVWNNRLKGPLPSSISNLSAQLRILELGSNQIYGSIQLGIGNLVNLNELELEANYLTGEIPPVIGMFSEMQSLYLSRNQFSGLIPDSFYNSTQLTNLELNGNELHGRIPPSVGNCKNLFRLDLSDNRLNGTIPKKVIALPSLILSLNLSKNDLTGSLPSEVGNLSSLQSLDISRNGFSGQIPNTLANCLTLESLYMDNNFLEGNISQVLSTLKGLKRLDLSRNKFSGEVPKYLGNFIYLTYLNLSYNEFEGPVPKNGIFANASVFSVVGNNKLCGGVVDLKLFPCHINKKGMSLHLKVVVSVSVICLCLALLACFFLVFLHRRKSRKTRKKPSSSFLSNRHYPRISYAELLKATNGFSVDSLLGVGSYGCVYKGIIDQDNTIVAVKVLNLQQRGASKSFLNECNALRNVRHRNLLKIITACSSLDFQGNDFKALVFEFMPNGSLDEWLHPKADEEHASRHLNFIERLHIAIDVASALDYLHHHCQPTIVHCDLKPSNILLDDDMTAHVADFGLAKFFAVASDNSSDQASSMAIKGSIGYLAPEYGMTSEVSTQGDVYSYGILLLEMLTGKRPTDEMPLDGQNLHTFARKGLSNQVMNIVDSRMLLKSSDGSTDIINQSEGQGGLLECLESTIELGVTCSDESPFERMNMGEVITELYHIRDRYQGF